VRTLLVPSSIGFALLALTLACSPAAAPPAATPTSDAFAVVRATAQAAYASGKAHLDQGEYLQACVDLDAARTNDPDNRPEIQQTLQQALQYCLTPPPEATAAPVAAQQRTLVVATLAVALAGTPTPAPSAAAAKPGGSPSTESSGGISAPPSAAPVPASSLASWSDAQGRFSISAPKDWSRTDSPPTLFGTGIVAFRDPKAVAELDVAVDTNTKAVSPELYSASMDLAMQQQVPGYAGEQVVPGTTSGNPSLRRVFNFTQRDSAGRDHQARGFQLTVVKGSTPYIIAASAPADQYPQYSPTFDQIVETFRFS
jgi:hypothetical protein